VVNQLPRTVVLEAHLFLRHDQPVYNQGNGCARLVSRLNHDKALPAGGVERNRNLSVNAWLRQLTRKTLQNEGTMKSCERENTTSSGNDVVGAPYPVGLQCGALANGFQSCFHYSCGVDLHRRDYCPWKHNSAVSKGTPDLPSEMAPHPLRSGFVVSCPFVYFSGHNVDNRAEFRPWLRPVVSGLPIPHSYRHECNGSNLDLVRTWVVATWVTRCELLDSVALGVSAWHRRLML